MDALLAIILFTAVLAVFALLASITGTDSRDGFGDDAFGV